jgi:hypothetical protein
MIVTQIATTLMLLSFIAMVAVSFFMDGENADVKPGDWIAVTMRPIDYAMLGCVVVFFMSITVAIIGLIWGL